MCKENATVGDGSAQPSRDLGQTEGTSTTCEEIKCPHKSEVTPQLSHHGSVLPGVGWTPAPVTNAQEGNSCLKNSRVPPLRLGWLNLAYLTASSPALCVSFPTSAPGPARSCGSRSEFKTLDLVLSCPSIQKKITRTVLAEESHPTPSLVLSESYIRYLVPWRGGRDSELFTFWKGHGPGCLLGLSRELQDPQQSQETGCYLPTGSPLHHPPAPSPEGSQKMLALRLASRTHSAVHG